MPRTGNVGWAVGVASWAEAPMLVAAKTDDTNSRATIPGTPYRFIGVPSLRLRVVFRSIGRFICSLLPLSSRRSLTIEYLRPPRKGAIDSECLRLPVAPLGP